MPNHQEILEIQTRGRGMFDISSQIDAIVRRSEVRTGLVSVFCQHTSCSLLIMENADPTARQDLEAWLERLAPDGDPHYTHDAEGPDDMSAHLRMALTRTHETIPIAASRLLLGTWQGLFLCEHRTSPHRRRLVVTVVGS
ncbi:MAG: YjbQ family protein [Opitutaceae bacterium]|nr:YjbQ family protein [Opitutaceae bacterium]